MTTNKKRKNYQKEVAQRLIDRIQQTGLLPWECPWTKIPGSNLIPVNFHTKAEYSGINILALWSEAQKYGYTANQWMTSRQAKNLGAKVRKGEQSVICVRYGQYTKTELNENTGEEEEITRAFSKGFPLYNIEQFDGLDIDGLTPKLTVDPSDAVDRIEQLASNMANHTGLNLSVAGDRAYYAPGFDRVNMPARDFKSPEAYAATYAHELTHSTGHKKRLGRFDELHGKFEGMNADYAFEELVAEMGAAFVCAELGIQGRHEQHATYLDHWLKQLESDYRFLTQAASAAAKAHSFIMEAGSAKEVDEKPGSVEAEMMLHAA